MSAVSEQTGLVRYWSARDVRADTVSIPFEVDTAPAGV
jgi:hypothetical protein